MSELSSENKGPSQRFKQRLSPSNLVAASFAAFMIAVKLTRFLSSSLESLERSWPSSGHGCGWDGPPICNGGKVSSMDASLFLEVSFGRLPLRSSPWTMLFKIPNEDFKKEILLRQIKFKDTEVDVTLPLPRVCERGPPYPERCLESNKNENTCQSSVRKRGTILQHSISWGTCRCPKKCLQIRSLILGYLQVTQKLLCREVLFTSRKTGYWTL